MTREEEIALLIQQQERDDRTKIISPRAGNYSLSLDAPVVGELIGVDEEGRIVDYAARRPGDVMGRRIPHGTPGGYVNNGCRCPSCTHAQSAYHKSWYAKNRLKPLKSLVCARESCGKSFKSRQPHARFCSPSCRDKEWYALKGKYRRRQK